MKKSYAVVLGVVALAVGVLAAVAQQQRASPHDRVSIQLAGGKKLTIEYGRPYMKGRKIMGGLVPYGQVWRTGADEATTLTTEADLDIQGLSVLAGSYALFTVPSEKGWKLIVNKVAKQWGAFKYDESQDLGRVDMEVTRTASPVEQFTITLMPAGGNKAILKMEWENTSAAVPIAAKP